MFGCLIAVIATQLSVYVWESAPTRALAIGTAVGALLLNRPIIDHDVQLKCYFDVCRVVGMVVSFVLILSQLGSSCTGGAALAISDTVRGVVGLTSVALCLMGALLSVAGSTRVMDTTATALVTVGVCITAFVHPLAALEAAPAAKPLCDAPTLLLAAQRLLRTGAIVLAYCTAVGIRVSRCGRLSLDSVATASDATWGGLVGCAFVTVTPLALLLPAMGVFLAGCVHRRRIESSMVYGSLANRCDDERYQRLTYPPSAPPSESEPEEPTVVTKPLPRALQRLSEFGVNVLTHEEAKEALA
tara:strand:- start:152 stop:1054 length:903 start_codon:yes stop_codon:yes gene_type:complete